MRTLKGWRILVPRPQGQGESLAERLRSLGAEPLLFPAIRIEPPENWMPVDDALRRAPAFHWVVFTSANGVRMAMERLQALGLGPEHLRRTRLAVVGPATLQALQHHGLVSTAMPSQFLTEAIADALGDVHGQRILLLRSEGARKALVDLLTARGAQVEEVAVYRVVPRQDGAELQRLLAPLPHLVVLTSPSIARALASLALCLQPPVSPGQLPAVCIGPITAISARQEGFPVIAVAVQHSEDGLIDAVLEAVGRYPTTLYREVACDPNCQQEPGPR
ncbi:Uroporphyrinogen-III synthase [bacterium HR23]|nr:Uroporphyrinogen-III synthase [bacterium HR23]